ncbi:MAG: copper chaperone PCu(A)C, partial [Macromonas bipunctata]|nr:copper chaperone PCu(A)C [Macromonas bipunctata]
MQKRWCVAAMVLGLSLSAWAQTVKVEQPWVRATVPQQRATGAFMQLTASADSRLVAAQSPVAGVVEIHEMVMERDVMKMRAVPGLPLPAGQAVALQPGGYHVMLMDLKTQVKPGVPVPLTLVFEHANGTRETLELQAEARAMNPRAPGSGPM